MFVSAICSLASISKTVFCVFSFVLGVRKVMMQIQANKS